LKKYKEVKNNMKCVRCGAKLGKTVDGWKNCKKCGLAKFVGIKQPKEKIKDNAEIKE